MTALRNYPLPVNETARAATVAVMNLETRRDDRFFAHVTSLVRRLLGTPIAFISLFDEDRQTFLARDGIDFDGTPREASLCSFTVAERRTIVFPDTHADPRSVNHPIVTGPGVRFSASAPVILATGFCMGTVCGVDLVPHGDVPLDRIAMLEDIAGMVARFYEVPLEEDAGKVAALRHIAETAQEEFLSLVGHELRTPLNHIYGLAQVIAPATEDDQEIVAAILSASEQLESIVGSILSFTQLRSGDIALDESEIDLDGTLGATLASFGKLASLRGKRLDLAEPAGLRLRGDRALIELALACLVTNFIAHGGSHATVAARGADDGTVEIVIDDNGAGIAPAYADRIWSAFGVGARVRQRSADGIGLGLPLTRRIVEMHGGDLALATTPTGLRARIRLPGWRRIDRPG